MNKPYRFTKRKRNRYYEVMFAHIPDVWFSTHSETLEGAIEFAQREMNKSSNYKPMPTLREFADGFFTDADPHGYRHRLERRDTFYAVSYYEQHTGRLNKYILNAHGGYLINAISDVMIEDFILDIPNLANSSKNKVLSCYRIVMHEAVREGYISSNPADKVKELPENYNSRQVFTEEEYLAMFPSDDDALVAFWGSLKWAVYFCMLKDTGWRPNEVSAFEKRNWFPELRGVYTTDSVDFRTHEIKHSIKTTRKGQPFKGGFVTEQTARLLQSLINTTPTEHLFHLSPRYASRYIYPERANEQLRLRCALGGVNLGDRTQYCFRHTFNTQALGTMPEVARLLLMGHTKNRQEYNHLTPRQTLERIANNLQE